MTLTLDLTSLGIDMSFPEELFVLFHPQSNKHGCYKHQDVTGLAVFSDSHSAIQFTQKFNVTGLITQEVSFEEAREIAKNKPEPIIAVILCDYLDNPMIHYVK